MCRTVNVILTPNKTCKTKLQCCASHFTITLGLGMNYISVYASSECVSNWTEALFAIMRSQVIKYY